MSDPTTTPAPSSASSGLTVTDAVNLITQLGAVAGAINPLWGGAIAAITGIGQVVENLIPEIQKMHDTQLSLVQQAKLQVDSASLRAKVGAPAATIN